MDTSEYLGMFLAESREHLQTLNLAVIRIEETPDDSATIDEIFRIAHSLKGMSGTMGFARMAALTHTMEDVFETLRGRTGALERRVIDVLAGVPGRARGRRRGDRARRRRAARPDGADRPPGRARGRRRRPGRGHARPAPPPRCPPPWPPTPPTPRSCTCRVALAADVLMPAVRAYMVLAAVADHGEIVWSSPTPDEVDAFSGSGVEAWVATEHDAATIEAAVRAVPDVADRDRDAGAGRRPPSPPPRPPSRRPHRLAGARRPQASRPRRAGPPRPSASTPCGSTS